jgi:hypothetical protein
MARYGKVSGITKYFFVHGRNSMANFPGLSLHCGSHVCNRLPKTIDFWEMYGKLAFFIETVRKNRRC